MLSSVDRFGSFYRGISVLRFLMLEITHENTIHASRGLFKFERNTEAYTVVIIHTYHV